MKVTRLWAVTAAFLSSSVSAFPAIALEAAAIKARTDTSTSAEAAHAAHEKRLNGIAPGFDAAAQLIDVSGAHAFVPPDFDAGDLRGPCPGLNALANHNYVSPMMKLCSQEWI